VRPYETIPHVKVGAPPGAIPVVTAAVLGLYLASCATSATDWQRINANVSGSYIHGIAADPEGDVWLVGEESPSAASTSAVAFLNRHGTWSNIPIPSNGTGALAITALSPSDAWAVGSPDVAGHPLIDRWDGVRWKPGPPLPAPSLDTQIGLDTVSATSSSDVWVAGYRSPLKKELAIAAAVAAHWDGTLWRFTDVPKAGELDEIVDISPRDVWAVGSSTYGAALLEHWDGAAWSIESTLPIMGELAGISVLNSADIWVVGYQDHEAQDMRPLIEHWDGKSWSNASPSIGAGQLTRISAISANDAWAIGDTGYAFSPSPASSLTLPPSALPSGFQNVPVVLAPPPPPLIAHWDGHSWGEQPAPPIVGLSGVLEESDGTVIITGDDAAFSSGPNS
jgi:hypothetical protein